MRLPIAVSICALALPAAAAPSAEAFNACNVFTQVDAEAVMQTHASLEAASPGAPRGTSAVASCTYRGLKEGQPVEATAQFRFSRSEAETQRAFDVARMQLQTQPLLISGAKAFWSAKTGELNIYKGRAWITVAVGPEKIRLREVEPAKQLAEMLVNRL